MKCRKKLSRFNFWSRRVDYKTRRGVQGVLRNTLSTVQCATTCTSDQGGSQDDGGGSCNADGTGG